MPTRIYKPMQLGAAKRVIIDEANRIIADYQSQGFTLTLRQIYYRFIAEDLFPSSWIDTEYNLKNNLSPDTKNTVKNYKKLGDIIGEGRMSGRIDWNGIEDRTRELIELSHWETPGDIIKTCVNAYNIDRWTDQKYRVSVYVEKDALEGIVKRAAQAYDCAVFSCRGYSSMSSLWEAAQRFTEQIEARQRPVILHLGDHDPSGIDMSRDITDRINDFVETDWLYDHMAPEGIKQAKRGEIWRHIEKYIGNGQVLMEPALPVTVKRIALTREQVDQYNPPPNPAKVTDSRYKKYEEIHGTDSWELDALEPRVLTELIQSEIEQYLSIAKYDARVQIENKNRERLQKTSTHWNDGLSDYVDKLKLKPKPKGKAK